MDVRDDLYVGISGHGTELDPVGMADKLSPILLAGLHAIVRQHVGQTWQPGTNNGLTKEDRKKAGLAKNSNLSFFKHPDLG